MSVVTLRLPDDQHKRLKVMAKSRGVSLNKLFEQLTAQVLTENDVELRFRAMAATGSKQRGLQILDMLDQADRKN